MNRTHPLLSGLRPYPIHLSLARHWTPQTALALSPLARKNVANSCRYECLRTGSWQDCAEEANLKWDVGWCLRVVPLVGVVEIAEIDVEEWVDSILVTPWGSKVDVVVDNSEDFVPKLENVWVVEPKNRTLSQ